MVQQVTQELRSKDEAVTDLAADRPRPWPAHGHPAEAALHKVVVVGGGAAGLELATKLGNTLGRRGQASVTLVERARGHLWKPLLHEVAAGSMDPDEHELDYLAQAHWHHFRFRYGEMTGLDRAPIELHVNAPERQFFLFLDDVRVDGDRLLGDEGDGLRQVFNGLNPERIIGAAAGNGIARYALARAAAYANQRQVWGVPIGAHQGLAHPLAEAKIEVELARLMTQKAAWATDAGVPGAGEAANMAKYAAAEAALHAVDVAIQVHGGNGFAAEYGIAGLWWMARVLRTAPVSREMILNYVAEHSLRLPRSY